MARFCDVALVVCLATLAFFNAVFSGPASAQSAAARPPGVPGLIAQLSAPDPESRAIAACGLATRRRDALPALAELTRLLADATPLDPVWCDEDRFVTLTAPWRSAPGVEAARALATLGDAGIDVLLRSVSSPNTDIRRHALRGLSYVRSDRLRGTATVDALLRALRDSDAEVRAGAARLLGRTQRGR